MSTNLQYRSRTGSWRWFGKAGSTDPLGCVKYRISKGWRRHKVRIRATGVVTAWNAVLDGTSPYYAKAGNRSYLLGVATLAFSFLPATTPPVGDFGVDTSAWLAEMSNACAGTGQSPAVLVACYMDRHGLHGNVVVLDVDGDGVQDDADRWPLDPSIS